MQIFIFLLLTVVVPIVINKSTESGRLDFIHPYLREIWMTLLVIGTLYLLGQPSIGEFIMRHWGGRLAYPIIFVIGGALLCTFWWTTGRFFPNKTKPSDNGFEKLTIEDRATTTTLPSPAIVAKDTSRVMARLTPHQLAQIYEQRTTVEANKLAEVHVGTWLPVSGSVLDMWEDKQKPTMAIRLDGVRLVIFCSFRQEWYQRTGILQKGDQVNIIGKIVKVDSIKIDLEECELNN